MTTNMAKARAVGTPGLRTVYSMCGMRVVRYPMEVTVEGDVPFSAPLLLTALCVLLSSSALAQETPHPHAGELPERSSLELAQDAVAGAPRYRLGGDAELAKLLPVPEPLLITLPLGEDGAADADTRGAGDDPLADPDGWRFILESHWWAPLQIVGPLDVGPATADVDIDLETLLENLNFIMEGGFTLTNDKWTLMSWLLYMDIGKDVETTLRRERLGSIETSLGFKAMILDIAGGYRIVEGPLGSSETATWGFDLLTGVVIWHTDVSFSARGPLGIDPDIDEVADWVDWIVGGRLLFSPSDNLDVWFRGDIGGFGIGSSSDLSWNVTALAEYWLNHRLGLVAGYRYLDVNWSQGEGRDEVGYQWSVHGPIAGLKIRF